MTNTNIKRLIVSEHQAERIGEQRTNGKRGHAFTVFNYVHKPSGLTVFGVEIKATGETIAVA